MGIFLLARIIYLYSIFQKYEYESFQKYIYISRNKLESKNNFYKWTICKILPVLLFLSIYLHVRELFMKCLTR